MNEETSTSDASSIKESSPCLQGERVAFTGTLASMTHREAHALVERNGGTATHHISRATTMLVMGEEGWPLDEDGQPALKWRQAEQLRVQGVELRVITESEWLHLIGLEENRSEVKRQYTPAMLSQMLDLSVHVIRRWERVGLIHATRRIGRLPYFDFREVSGVRRLSQLLNEGVPRQEIEKSLGRLTTVFGNLDRPLTQLEILASGSHVVCRDEIGLLDPVSGQRLFGFDDKTSDPPPHFEVVGFEEQEPTSPALPSAPPPGTAAMNWYQQGCRLLEDDDAAGAAEAFRLHLMEHPGDAETHFHLAEALYRQERPDAALERYHVAVECDHDYIEAWTQMGCLYAESGDHDAALAAYEIALQTHPDYPDALWHKAEALYHQQRVDEAKPIWQRYLDFDSRGPWADIARQRLEELQGGDSADAGADAEVDDVT